MAICGNPASLFGGSVAATEFDWLMAPEPSTAGLLFVATTDPIGRLIADFTRQPYCNIGFVCPKVISGKRHVLWLNPWGEIHEPMLFETTIEDLACNPLVSEIGYRKLRDNTWSGKWGLTVAGRLIAAKRPSLEEAIFCLFGCSTTSGTGKSSSAITIIEDIFRDMGWQLDMTFGSGTPVPDRADLISVFCRMISPLSGRPNGLHGALNENNYFLQMERIGLAEIPPSKRELAIRSSTELCRPILQKIFSVIIGGLTTNSEFLQVVIDGINRVDTGKYIRQQAVVGIMTRYSDLSRRAIGLAPNTDGRKRLEEELAELDRNLEGFQ